MWGEHVKDDNFEYNVWPRAAVTAERLWSPKDVRDVDEAESRLLQFNDVLLRRGVNSCPVQPHAICKK